MHIMNQCLTPHRETFFFYFALNVGPNASLAKLLGKSGFPGPRSATGSYGTSSPHACLALRLENDSVRLAEPLRPDDEKDALRFGPKWRRESALLLR